MKPLSFKEWFLLEMPINKFQTIGNFDKNSSFDQKDRAILTQPKAIEKIRKKFANTDFPFDFYFINNKKLSMHNELGEVNQQWVKNNLGIDLNPSDDAITVIFLGNRATEKMPMTSWTIGHRMGHAIRRGYFFEELSKDVDREFSNILVEGYRTRPSDQNMMSLIYALGTMKSCREKNLRNKFEFLYELIAQFLINGKVQFNPLPEKLYLRSNYGRPKFATLTDQIYPDFAETLERDINITIYTLLGTCYNKIFVM